MKTSSATLCPICGEGKLHLEILPNAVEYKGLQGTVDMRLSVCDVCGSEQAGPEEARANKRAMMAFRKQADGLWPGMEIRAFRERLGISQAEAAKIFGGGPVAFSKYENDDVAQSEAMDKLLRVADAVSAAFEWLASAVGEIEIARRAKIRRFEKWRASMEKLVMPVPRCERPTITASQTSTLTLHASANDQHYREVLGA